MTKSDPRISVDKVWRICGLRIARTQSMVARGSWTRPMYLLAVPQVGGVYISVEDMREIRDVLDQVSTEHGPLLDAQRDEEASPSLR